MANPAIHQVAQRFARALDAEDYESVRAVLANDCTYEARTETFTGRGTIISSYRESGSIARRLFDSVEYSSQVVGAEQDTARITFIDKISKDGRTHIYHCRQMVDFRPDGLIGRITHAELPGERERLLEFCASCNVELNDSRATD